MNPDCFKFYWLLAYEGLSVEKIRKAYSLSEKTSHEFLRSLARLGLVRIESPEEVRISQDGIILWEDFGPLVKQITRLWASELVQDLLQEKLNPSEKSSFFALRSLMISEREHRELNKELSELLDKYHKNSLKGSNLHSSQMSHFRVIVGAAPGSFVKTIRQR
jgi:hypothetical protein